MKILIVLKMSMRLNKGFESIVALLFVAFLLSFIVIRVMRVGSDTFGDPIFQKGLQN